MEKGKKDLIQTRCKQLLALFLGDRQLLDPNRCKEVSPTQQNQVEVAVGKGPAGLPGLQGHRKLWAPLWGLNGFFSLKTNAGLVCRFVCAFAPPRHFLFSSPRLSPGKPL